MHCSRSTMTPVDELVYTTFKGRRKVTRWKLLWQKKLNTTLNIPQVGLYWLSWQSLIINEVKCSLTDLTTRSDCSQLLSVVLLYLHMCWIPCALRGTVYSWVWQEEGAFCVECLAVFPSLPLLSTVYQCDRCLSSRGRGGSWLVCQFLPAFSAVCILELAANSGSSRIAQAPSLHLAKQLLIIIIIKLINNSWWENVLLINICISDTAFSSFT